MEAQATPGADGAAVRIEGLSKRFDGVQALDGISLSIRPGEFFGLVGPNGAGKTTTVRILATVTLPDEGTVRVLGRDPVKEPAAVRGLIDVMTARDRFYNRISGWANLSFLCGLHGAAFERDRAAALAERLGLEETALDRPVRTYSTGMVQKLNLVRGLLLDRPVLLLDEPSLGLDPVSARAYKQILRELLSDGRRTILFTSHNMYEVEELCDRVAIINQGRITATGRPGDLKAAAFPSQELVLGFQDGGGGRGGGGATVGPADLQAPGVLSVREEAGLTIVELDGSADLDEVIRQAQRHGRLRTVHLREPTFEEAFVRHARDGGGGGDGGDGGHDGGDAGRRDGRDSGRARGDDGGAP